jgi:CRISPR/Cas system-associated exonuclease Cas4 (RecB family)
MSPELDLQQIIDGHLRQERAEQEASGEHIRKGWYATDLGLCPGGIYRQRLEGPPTYDERRLRLFSVGNIFHRWLLDKVRDAGYQALTEERIEMPEHHLSGRADLLITHNDSTTLYEIKTMHSQGFWYRQKSGGLALPHHELQVTSYMWMLKDKYPDMEARICYVSKDDLAVLTAPVIYREETVNEVKRQLAVLNQAWESHIPPEPSPSIIYDDMLGRWIVNWQAKYCNSHDKCAGDPEWLPKAEKQVKELNKKGG